MGKAWWQVPDIEKAACRKVWCMFWEAQEKTIASGWYFQVAGFRIHHQEEVPTSQGSNELPGMALSYHGELQAEAGLSGAMGGILSPGGDWPLETGFHLIPGF